MAQAFGQLLREHRKQQGLKQSELASQAGLTGSYISLLENRKKPPPSDAVIRRLARELGVDAEELLQLAHLERSPDSVRDQMERLREALTQERRVTEAFMGRVMPSSLFYFVSAPMTGNLSGYLVEQLRPEGVLRQLLERLQGSGSPLSLRERASELLTELTEEERADLAGELPEFLAQLEPLVLNRADGPLDNGSAPAQGSEVFVETNAMYPRLEPGDRVAVEVGASPEDGDLVLVDLPSGDRDFRRYLPLGSRIELAPVNPAVPPVSLKPDDARRRIIGVARHLTRRL